MCQSWAKVDLLDRFGARSIHSVGVTARDGAAVSRARLARIRTTPAGRMGGAGRAGGRRDGVPGLGGVGFRAAIAHWLYQNQAWWRVWLRPDGFQAQLVLVGLWLVALLCYWWPRRLQPRVVGLTTVRDHGADRRCRSPPPR